MVISRNAGEGGLPAKQLVVIERDRRLYRVLATRFPEVRILNMDAVQALEALNEEYHGEVGSIVSGLPLLSMPPDFQDQLLAESFKVLGRNGDFIQFAAAARKARTARSKGIARAPEHSARVRMALCPDRRMAPGLTRRRTAQTESRRERSLTSQRNGKDSVLHHDAASG